MRTRLPVFINGNIAGPQTIDAAHAVAMTFLRPTRSLSGELTIVPTASASTASMVRVSIVVCGMRSVRVP